MLPHPDPTRQAAGLCPGHHAWADTHTLFLPLTLHLLRSGLTLLEMLRDHYARLPADLADAVWTGALTAARASMKRNVGPGYTNVCVLGTYVTLVAGESLGDEALRSYGTNRLIR